MKTYLAILFALAASAFGQQQQPSQARKPDCLIFFTLTNSSLTSAFADNRQVGCFTWAAAYTSTGFSGLTVTVQQSLEQSNTPTSWATFTGSGNPSTATDAAIIQLTGYQAWVRVQISGLTGSGTVKGVLFGFLAGSSSSGGGGSGNCPGGINGDIQFKSGTDCVGPTDPYTNEHAGSFFASAEYCRDTTFTVTTDFGGFAAPTGAVRAFSAPPGWSARSFRIIETTTVTSGSGTVTAVAASIGTLAVPTGYMLPFPLLGSTGQMKEVGGGVTLATADNATQDIYLQLAVTNTNPGNLSSLTGGVVKTRICGTVGQ